MRLHFKYKTKHGFRTVAIAQARINTLSRPHYINVYIDLRGHIRPRINPTPGMYKFDGQFFFKESQL